MTVLTLDQLCNDIETTKSIKHLFGIRAMLQGLLKAGQISYGMYQGLNKDIRDRFKWFRNDSSCR